MPLDIKSPEDFFADRSNKGKPIAEPVKELPSEKIIQRASNSKILSPEEFFSKNNNIPKPAETPEEFASMPISQDSVNQQAEKVTDFFSSDALNYIGKSLGAGLSQSIVPNEMETDIMSLKVAGVVMNALGTIVTGVLLPEVALFSKAGKATSAALRLARSEKILAPLFGAGEKAVAELGKETTKLAAKKFGQSIGNAAATGTVYGGAIEGIKSVRAGEGIEDTLANIITGATLGAAGGVVIGGALEGAAGFVGRKVEGKLNQDLKQVFSKKENVDFAKAQTENINLFPKEYVAANSDKFAKKVNEINPVLMPWELAARPELLKGDLNKNLKPVIEDLFLNPKGAGAIIYQQNEQLQKLVETEQYAAALSNYSSMMRSQVKSNQYLSDYIKEPFYMDSKVMADSMADHLIGSTDRLKSANLTAQERNKLVNYVTKPTDENFNDLLLIDRPGMKRAVFGTKGVQEKLKSTINGNIRLKPQELDILISNRLSELYKTVSNGIIDGNNAAFIGDYDSTLKSIITFNKALTRGVAESFVKGQTMSDFVSVVEPKDRPLVQNLLNKRIDQNDLVRLQKERIKLSSDFALAQKKGEPELVASAKKELDLNLRKLYRTQSAIDEVTSKTNEYALPPEELQRINKIVDSAYLPRPETLAKKLDQATKDALSVDPELSMSKNLVKAGLFNRDNPAFVKDMTDLSDLLQAMDHAGYDVDLTKLSFDSPVSNIQRRMMKEFGLNSPIQKVFNYIKDTDIQKQSFVNNFIYDLKKVAPEFKPGTNVDKLIRSFVEGKISVTDPVFLNLSAKEQQTLKETAKFMSGVYDKVIDTVNPILIKNNEKQITRRSNYFPHYEDNITKFKQKLALNLRGETNPEEFKGLSPDRPQYSKKRKFASFEKQRTGMLEAKENLFKTDMLGGYESFEKYLKDASDLIYGTGLSKGLNAIAEFAPSKFGETIRKINETYVLGIPHKLENQTAGKILGEIRRRTSKSLLLGTPSVLLQQVLSIPTSAAFGGKEAISALWKGFTPEGKAALAASRNLKLRNAQAEGFDFTKGKLRPLIRKFGGKPGNIASDIYTKYEQFTEKALGLFDSVAASHAFMTGYQKGIKLGLKSDEAIMYGDHAANLLQGEMTKMGQPEFMQNPYGRTLAQFMSYSMNMFATLADDLPMIAKSDGAQKALGMIFRTYAGMTLTNEVLRDNGLPPQFDIAGFFPYHDGNRGQIPGAVGVISNVLANISNISHGKTKESKDGITFSNWTGRKGTDYESSKSIKKFEGDVMNLIGVPGIGGLNKALKASKNEEIDNKVTGAIFGSKVESKHLQSSKERQRAFKKTPLRKKIKKTLFR